ncbi:MAG: SUMF1/EgtB/PvdO family nonheme iron enzyme, partial [Verrucomicrobiota bacterium]
MNPHGTLVSLAAAACIAAGILSVRAEITIDLVPVGNAGNPADQAYGTNRPFGAVSYDFAIGKYEVTNAQYASFLNAMATTDTYWLYPTTLKYPLTRGILQSGSPGNYTYSIADNMADKPANNMTWFSAARFVNWLANGQPTGAQNSATTENGAYALNGTMTGGFEITRNTVNPNTAAAPLFWMPSEDEWYKAAFYQPESSGGPSGSYWLYPTGSSSAPTVATADATGNISNPGANVANYLSGSSWNGQFENVTTVGSAGALSASFYGTYDQAGNVWEWSEGIEKAGTARGLRQGSANDPNASYLAASFGDNGRAPDTYYWNAGLRIASVIPEPSAIGLILLASGAGWLAGTAAKKRKQPARPNPRVRKEMRGKRIADLL